MGGWLSLRRFGGNRRAVSPVLSTVLLVLIVVLGMSMAFAFFVDYVSDYQRGRGSSVLELVEIEDVYFINQTDGSIEVWLYNYGKIEVEVDTVYVNGLLVDNFNFTGNSSVDLGDVDEDDSVEVKPYAHAMFNMTLVDGWVPDNVAYIFRFVTERGSAFEREYSSPKIE